jgi:hypothetical protein
MSFIVTENETPSAYIESIIHGHTSGSGTVVRPAETHWHLVLLRLYGKAQMLMVGPLTASGLVSFGEGAELIWVKFSLGTFMPHLPTKTLVNSEIALPGATDRSFWLHGAAWEFPTPENVDVFVEKLVQAEVLVRDTAIHSTLQAEELDMAERTIRHRFLRATGLTQKYIRQHERALQAARLLQQGVSILDTVFETGYYDQPHLTRALKHTPAQLVPTLPALKG